MLGRALARIREEASDELFQNLHTDQLETHPEPPSEQQLGLPQMFETLR